jgi:hypothetical protein
MIASSLMTDQDETNDAEAYQKVFEASFRDVQREEQEFLAEVKAVIDEADPNWTTTEATSTEAATERQLKLARLREQGYELYDTLLGEPVENEGAPRSDNNEATERLERQLAEIDKRLEEGWVPGSKSRFEDVLSYLRGVHEVNDQSYYFMAEWQRDEAESLAELAAGEGIHFETAIDALQWLVEPDYEQINENLKNWGSKSKSK